MSSGYEVSAADAVQYEPRRRIRQLGGYALAALVLRVGALGLMHAGTLSAPVVGLGLAAVWSGTGAVILCRLRRLRHVMWCIKIGPAGVMGYDYARRPVTLPWSRIRRVNLSDDGLRIVRSADCYLDVPARFPAFVDLSHRLVARAEARGVPIWIDGAPYEALDVYAHFPFLTDDASSSAPHDSTAA